LRDEVGVPTHVSPALYDTINLNEWDYRSLNPALLNMLAAIIGPDFDTSFNNIRLGVTIVPKPVLDANGKPVKRGEVPYCRPEYIPPFVDDPIDEYAPNDTEYGQVAHDVDQHRRSGHGRRDEHRRNDRHRRRHDRRHRNRHGRDNRSDNYESHSYDSMVSIDDHPKPTLRHLDVDDGSLTRRRRDTSLNGSERDRGDSSVDECIDTKDLKREQQAAMLNATAIEYEKAQRGVVYRQYETMARRAMQNGIPIQTKKKSDLDATPLQVILDEIHRLEQEVNKREYVDGKKDMAVTALSFAVGLNERHNNFIPKLNTDTIRAVSDHFEEMRPAMEEYFAEKVNEKGSYGAVVGSGATRLIKKGIAHSARFAAQLFFPEVFNVMDNIVSVATVGQSQEPISYAQPSQAQSQPQQSEARQQHGTATSTHAAPPSTTNQTPPATSPVNTTALTTATTTTHPSSHNSGKTVDGSIGTESGSRQHQHASHPAPSTSEAYSSNGTMATASSSATSSSSSSSDKKPSSAPRQGSAVNRKASPSDYSSAGQRMAQRNMIQ